MPFGLEGLRKSLSSHINKPVKTAAHSVIKTVKNFGHGDLRDDIMLIIAQLK